MRRTRTKNIMTTSATARNMKSIHLDWSEDFDNDDNSIFEAASPYLDGEEGSPFQWRIRQQLKGNKIVWFESSDLELIADPEYPREWATLEEAKKALQKDHAEILKEIASDSP
jgi:hypothetical protein